MADISSMLQAAAGSGGLATSYTPILDPSTLVENPDPFEEYLSLAMPVTSTLGYGDRSATIKGTGSNKPVSTGGATGSPGIFYSTCGIASGTRATLAMDQYSDLTLTGPFCIEVWFNMAGAGDFGFFFGKTSIESGRGKGWKVFTNIGRSGIGNPGKLNWAANNTDIPIGLLPGAAGSDWAANYALNTWHHVAMTRDENNIGRIYFNGVVQRSDPMLTGSYVGSDSFEFPTNAYQWSGRWQDFRVYVGTSKYAPGGFSVAEYL